jgi:hypothetical protein
LFHKHSRSFIKSSTNGVWSSFRLKTIVGISNSTEATRQQTVEAPVVDRGGTRLHWSLSITHPGWFIYSERKLATANFRSSFILDDHFWWMDSLHCSLLVIHPKWTV